MALLLCAILGSAGCAANNPEDNNNDPEDNTPCACTVGAKRCRGDQIQVCEATNPSCPTWGPEVACPTGACTNNSCPGSCSDSCQGGTTRCASDSDQEICRISGSGCLDWVRQPCPSAQYCGGSACQPAIPCDPSCPGGYTCKPTGVCAGGSPKNLVLDVKTVNLAGSVTVNGATPTPGSMCASYPNTETVFVELREVTKGYSFVFTKYCRDTSPFTFSGGVFPGTYSVSVRGGYSNIPSASYVANAALAVTKDTAGVVLDVKTFNVSGSVTLNGAAPTPGSMCASYPNTETVYVDLREVTKGYSFVFAKYCRDASPFTFSGSVFPGTYSVSVRGGYSNIPSASFEALPSLVVSKDTAAIALDVKSFTVSGSVTMNGVAPTPGSMCASYPNTETVYVDLREVTKGYSFVFTKYCRDASPFTFSGSVFPGTYSVSVRGGYSNIPSASFVANPSLAVTKNTTGVALDVKTVNISGSVTLNGAAPTPGSMCASYPNTETAFIELRELTKGYSFVFSKYCRDASPFTFSGAIFPGTYAISVRGGYSNLPSASFEAVSSINVTKDTTGVALDVKTFNISGSVTMNGMPPTPGSMCASYPNTETVFIDLRETKKGYSFVFSRYCRDASPFAFSGAIFPGTYVISVRGGYSNLPGPSFIAQSSLTVTKDTPGIVLDVKTVNISGVVTLNGAAPMPGAMCASYPNTETVFVDLREAQKGYSFVFAKYCRDTSPFAFSGDVYPGTYSIAVRGGYSNLPSASFVAVSNIQIP